MLDCNDLEVGNQPEIEKAKLDLVEAFPLFRAVYRLFARDVLLPLEFRLLCTFCLASHFE